jgi:dTDP-4-dehydrorhamnose reductase
MANEVLVLGATSLVGSEFVESAGESIPIEAAGRTDPRSRGLTVRAFSPVELSERSAVERLLAGRRGDRAWLNFAARTDVDGCELERPATPPGPPSGRRDSAWTMNAELPGWLAEASRREGIPLLHVSTDFVFDGAEGPYAEEALPSPWGSRVGWYGFTKGVGESRVRAADPNATILRISYPYRTAFAARTDFARTLLARARAGTLYPLYTDQQITPTWIPDVSAALRAWIAAPRPGTFHVAAPELTSPWEFGVELCKVFHIEGPAPARARLAEAPAVAGRAPRPLRGGLRTDRLASLGVRPTGFREGLRAMAAELEGRSRS